jgi:Holliday junction resolvase RusA-like endonuclease
MNSIIFTVGGAAVPKGRPRFSKRGAVYTPSKTLDYEKQVQRAFIAAAPNHTPVTCAVAMSICIDVAIPKSWAKNRVQGAINGEVIPVHRFDVDNVAKAIMDALNGIAYDDDGRVCQLNASKRYAVEAKTVVSIIFLSKNGA